MNCVIPISLSGKPASATLGVRGRILVRDLYISENQTPFTVDRNDVGDFFTIADVSAFLDQEANLYLFGLNSSNFPGAIPVKFRSVKFRSGSGPTYFYDAAGVHLGELAIDIYAYEPQRDFIIGIPNRRATPSGTQFVNFGVGLCSPPGLFATSTGNGSLANGNGSLANGNGIPKIPLPSSLALPNGTQKLAALGNGSITLPTSIPTNTGTVCYPITDKISICYKN